MLKDLVKTVLTEPQSGHPLNTLQSQLGIDLLSDLKQITMGAAMERAAPKQFLGVLETKTPPQELIEKLRRIGKDTHEACLKNEGSKKGCPRFSSGKKHGRSTITIGDTVWSHLEGRLIMGAPAKTILDSKTLGRRKALRSKSVLNARPFMKPLAELNSKQTAWCVAVLSKALRKQMTQTGSSRVKGLEYVVVGLNAKDSIEFKLSLMANPKSAQALKNKVDAEWKQMFQRPMVRLMGLSPLQSRLKTTVRDGRFEASIKLDEAQSLRLQAIIMNMVKQRQRTSRPTHRSPPPTSPPPGARIKTNTQ